MPSVIQLRRDLAATWTSVNPVLAQGEVGYETDTNQFKVGDGTSTWTALSYFTGSGGGVTDHGALTGLADDDHTQYLNNARGDARYPLLSNTGTAASRNVPASGNASTTEVVLGTDTRLSDARTPTAHNHTLSQVTDVTITATNLNILDDGVNTTLHFHDSDRNRANHTGTQLATTISDFNTAADARITAATGVSVQGFDADLTAIGALAGTSGLLRKTAVNTWSLDTAIYLTGNQTITISGDATGSGTTAITLTIPTFNSTTKGVVPASGGGTTNFLRADGTWAAPPGGGGGVTTFQTSLTGLTPSTATSGAVTLAGTLGVASGGTGGTDAATARTNLGAAATSHGHAAGDITSGTMATARLGSGTADSTTFLRGDNTWAVPPGGGSGSPGGATTQVQYNNAGAFAGDSGFTFDATNDIVQIGATGLTGRLALFAVNAEPTAPPASTGYLYGRDIAGRMMPKWVGPSGVDYPLQSHIGVNNVRMWKGGATTTATTFAGQIGVMPYTSASPTAPTIPALASTTLLTQTNRSTISTGTTAGALAYIRGNQTQFWRGNAAGLGGYFVAIRFAVSGTLQAGLRCFAGIVDVVANPTNVDPTTTATPGGVGLAIAANTGNWRLVNNITGTARTALDLGASFAINNTHALELILFCAPNGSAINYRVTNLSTAAQTSGSLTTNIPANTTFMTPSVWITNNATAAAQTLDFISCYVETDY